MSMKYAVLGLVAERRGYGYDLMCRFNQRIGPNWRAPAGAVYVALDALQRDELVREAGVAGPPGGPRRSPRVVYEATETGVQALEDWLVTPSKAEPVRAEVFLRLVFAQPQHAPALEHVLEHFEQICLDELAQQGEDPELPSDGSGTVSWPVAASWLVHSATIARLDADRRWAQHARRALRTARMSGSVPVRDLLAAPSISA